MREDPQGKRALFEAPAVEVSSDVDGREAAFNHTPPGVRIECSKCDTVTKVPFGEAIAGIARFTVWLPGPRFNRWMTCPSCGRRAWCRIRWV